MLELLGLAWSAWKLSAKRLGPVGGVVFALASVVAFVLFRDWVADRYPNVSEALEKAV
ncbi:hypothetical protein HWV23_06280 [Natronomonas halophila]|uniref:hypothetical protein n=1 Tax=Natronomonas halophila TaxID=2747817 RepID=UPI0015B3C9C0|nr:hypothetical protein [Natronomonas halophila]QLD85350.1 hypothetical protein HWV23_06280 [Natronomonas halophila]